MRTADDAELARRAGQGSRVRLEPRGAQLLRPSASDKLPGHVEPCGERGPHRVRTLNDEASEPRQIRWRLWAFPTPSNPGHLRHYQQRPSCGSPWRALWQDLTERHTMAVLVRGTAPYFHHLAGHLPRRSEATFRHIRVQT